MRVQGVVLKHHGNVAFLWGHSIDLPVTNKNFACFKICQPSYDPQKSRFAAARRTYQRDKLTRMNFQIDVVEYKL